MVQVAKRGASVLKRRKSRNRMEPPNRETPNTPQDSAPPPRSESDGDVVFYTEEPRSGNYFFFLLSLKSFFISKIYYIFIFIVLCFYVATVYCQIFHKKAYNKNLI